MSYGVTSPAMTLEMQPFFPQGANRLHHRLVELGRAATAGSDGSSSSLSLSSSSNSGHHQHAPSGVPRYFLQSRKSCNEAALFVGRDKCGQVTEDQLELREVRITSEKLYKKGLFARHRTWKGPDGVKYSWQSTDDGDYRMVDSKSNHCYVYVLRQNPQAIRLIISAQVMPFIELMLLTWLQHDFEHMRKVRELQAAEDDKDQQLGVW